MSTNASASVALTADWLNMTNTVTNNTGATVTTTYWPYQGYGWCYHYDGPARPIRLTMSEVEKLRAAARKDAKLKAILSKFTDQIEIVVDFE